MWRLIARSAQSVSATAVASRGVRSTSDISPNMPPAPTFSTTESPMRIAARLLARRGHLAESLADPDGGDGLAFHDNADFPLQEQVDPVGHEQQRHAFAVLGEDGRALQEALRLARELEEIQRDRGIVERRRALGIAGTRRIQILSSRGSGQGAIMPMARGREEEMNPRSGHIAYFASRCGRRRPFPASGARRAAPRPCAE